MKQLFSVVIIIMFSACVWNGHKNDKNPKISAKEIQDHINYLASDKLEGRFTGSKGAEKAAGYIKEDYKSSGIKPLFGNSYFQNFPFIASLQLTKDNSLTLLMHSDELKLSLKDEYTPAPFSGSISFEGKIVFAGYGISAPELNYDDYDSINVKGKAVVVIRLNPDNGSPHSKFEKYTSDRFKAKTAKEKGAAAIIFVNGFTVKDGDRLMKLTYDGAGGIDSLAAVQVKRELIEKIFKAENLSFKEYQKKINNTKKADSFEFKNSTIKLKTGVEAVSSTGTNVAGILEGNDPALKNEYIVIGAHYDHIGYGETGSLYRGTESQIHNGADDNASGTAGVLEIAEIFASNKSILKRSVIFINFAGEELGLLGSSYFVSHSPVPIENISAMINLDMIGRLNKDKNLTIYGTGTSTEWKNLLEKENKNFNLKLNLVDDGFGPSDQSSFYGKKIPVLFLFTGIHADYHRPTDDAEKINSAGEEAIVNFIYTIALNIDTMYTKPDYVSIPRKDSGRPTKFRVYVGTIPDFGAQTDGFKISGVSEGSPAQKAGLKGGDIMIYFGGKKISNIYDYTYALGDFSPGDTVEVILLRDGKKVKYNVELGAR